MNMKKKQRKEIYLDCAATSRQKPPQVLKAVIEYATQVGVSHGRGTYQRGIKANELVFGVRAVLAKLFHIQRMDRIVNMKNVTEAINTALKGFLRSGDHVVLSSLEHNAVIRPLNKLKKDRGIEYTIVAANSLGRLNPYDFEKALKPNTKMVERHGKSGPGGGSGSPLYQEGSGLPGGRGPNRGSCSHRYAGDEHRLPGFYRTQGAHGSSGDRWLGCLLQMEPGFLYRGWNGIQQRQ
jgi:hypothetical protein